MKKFIIALCALSFTASAAEVYINGVNVDGLTNTTFEKVTVKLDDKGNVQIDAPGYAVKKVTMADNAPPVATGVITQQYYLVTEQNPPGATEYEVDVFLNGKFFRTVRSGDEQLVKDITKELKPGLNKVIAQARKKYENPNSPKSQSRAHVMRVIIGEGRSTRDQVTIDKQVVTFTRTAADTNDVTQEFSFTTR
jgi:hypothetical protein